LHEQTPNPAVLQKKFSIVVDTFSLEEPSAQQRPARPLLPVASSFLLTAKAAPSVTTHATDSSGKKITNVAVYDKQ
jgi:hypothetical protein